MRLSLNRSDRLRFTGLALLALLAVPAVAAQSAGVSLQQLHHTSWSTKDGLPVTGVFRIARTPDGYLWFSSAAGFFRFDGIRFTLIDSTVSPAMRSAGAAEPWPLVVDHRGAFLFAGKAGDLIQYLDGTFRQLNPDIPGLTRPGRATEDRQQRVWVILGNDRAIRQLQAGKLMPSTLPAGIPDTGILGVIPDSGRGLWFGTRTQGLWHISASNQPQQYPAPASDGAARPLLQDRTGALWVLGDGLRVLRDGRWSDVRLPGHPQEQLQAIAAVQSGDGAVWLGTRGDGVVRYRNGAVEQFSEIDGLSDAVVHDLLIDPAGAVWISTDAGLDRLRTTPFVTIDRQLGLPFDSPLGIRQDADGSIWAGAYGTGGLFHLDGGLIRRSGGPIRSIQQGLKHPDRFLPLSATTDGGLWLIDKQSGRAFRYHQGLLSPSKGIAPPAGRRWFKSVEDHGGRTWLSLQPRGLGVVRDGEFHPIALRPGRQDPTVQSMVLDRQDHLWVSTQDSAGLFELASPDRITQIPLDLPPVDPLRQLAIEDDGTLWGMVDGGLARVRAGRVDRVDIPEIATLVSTASQATLLQGDFLWLASEGGVARVSLTELRRAADGRSTRVTVRRFDDRDGLRVGKMSTLNQDPAFRGRDGRLWFSTPAGLAVFDPEAMTPSAAPPRPQIEQLIVGGIPVPLEPGLKLAPNPARVELRFTATNLAVPERAVLEYRLDGADRDWVRSGPERTVAYAQLRPGLYTFRVRAWNEDGVPGDRDAALVFRILPKWYQTLWFLALLVLAVAAAGAAALYAAQRARTRTANERLRARFEATLLERTRLARELHDTLLQGFTGITLQLQAVHRSMIDAPRDSAVALARVLTTADLTLREARQMVWDMRAPELVHNDLADALEEMARLAVVDTPIMLGFSVSGRRRRLPIGIETTALRIGRESVVNAVKHAAPRTITVALSYGEAALGLVVEDDGRGYDIDVINAAAGGGHWGIRGMQERASRSGGSLQLSGTTSGGMRITLTLPITEASGR